MLWIYEVIKIPRESFDPMRIYNKLEFYYINQEGKMNIKEYIQNPCVMLYQLTIRQSNSAK
jgi:hypothetical protein